VGAGDAGATEAPTEAAAGEEGAGARAGEDSSDGEAADDEEAAGARTGEDGGDGDGEDHDVDIETGDRGSIVPAGQSREAASLSADTSSDVNATTWTSLKPG